MKIRGFLKNCTLNDKIVIIKKKVINTLKSYHYATHNIVKQHTIFYEIFEKGKNILENRIVFGYV